MRRDVLLRYLCLLATFLALQETAARAQTCTEVPFVNGTTADADQLNNYLVCLAPIANPLFTGNIGVNFSDVSQASLNIGVQGNALRASGGAGISTYIIANPSGAGGFREGVGFNLGYSAGTWFTNTDGTNSGASAILNNAGAASGYSGIGFYTIPPTANAQTISNANLANYLRMMISRSGNVGIGTIVPAQALEVNGEVQIDSFGTATSTPVCELSGVLSSCSSSRRYKEDIKDAAFGLSEIAKMRPVTFKWKGRNEYDFGLIAEEVAKIDPLFVTHKGGRIEGVKYAQLTAVLVNAVKALKAANERQADQISRLATVEAAQAKHMAALERQIGTLEKSHTTSSPTSALELGSR